MQKRSFEVLFPSDTKCRFGCGIASEPKSGQLRVGPTFRSPITALWKVKQFRSSEGFPVSERQLLMVVYPILLPETRFCYFLQDPSLHMHLNLHAASLGWVVSGHQ